MWRDILKEKISVLELVNEKIEEGYTVFKGERPYTYSDRYFVRADKYNGLTFPLDVLHTDLDSTLIGREFADNDSVASQQEGFISKIEAAVRGLNLFLETVDRAGDLDKIEGSPAQNMRLVGSSGLIIIFGLSGGSDCNSRMLYDERESSMCLSNRLDMNRPVIPDYWVTTYSLFNMVKDEENEGVISQLTRTGDIPDVIRSAYDAVLYGDYEKVCGHCGNVLDEDEANYLHCRECGYYLDEPGEDELKAEEDTPVRLVMDLTGWECPYDNEFTPYGDSCDNHDLAPTDEGPFYGYNLQNGYLLGRVELYLLNDGEFLSDPNSGDFREYTYAEVLQNNDLEDLLNDLVEVYGDVEDALQLLGINSRDEGRTVTFEYGGDSYRYNEDTNELSFHDERFDKMQGHIISSGIEVEVDDSIPFEDALDEAIDKVEEIIEDTEMNSVEGSGALEDAKNLLLELQSMR